MRFLLLLSFLFLSMASGRSRGLPEKDQNLINELKIIGESLLRSTLFAELNGRLTVAQMIIDSNVAPQSVIDKMRTFISNWSPLLPRVTVEDYAKFSVDFPSGLELDELTKYKAEDGGLNYYTRGGFSAIKAKAEIDDRERLTAFKEVAVLKMGEVSQETKQVSNSLLTAFDDFVNQRVLKVRDFFTFLRELREY